MKIKKKIYFPSCVLMLLTAVVFLFPQPVLAETQIWEDYEYQYNEEYGGIEIVRYYGNETKVTLPESIEEIPVTAVGGEIFLEEKDPRYHYDFSGNKNYRIKKVIVPETVKVIKDYAFARCKKLKEAVLPDGLQELGVAAFVGCSKLEKLNIPSGLTMIPESAFAGCGLKEIEIPQNVTCIWHDSFVLCSQLKRVSFSEGSKLEKIKDGVFSQCVNLTEIRLPDSLKVLEESVFEGCVKLKKVEFGKNSKLRGIGAYSFSGCSALKRMVIPKRVATIQSHAFYNCENLKNIIFKGNVPRIEKNAFKEIHPNAVFRVPKKYLSRYKKKLMSRTWYQATMKVRGVK